MLRDSLVVGSAMKRDKKHSRQPRIVIASGDNGTWWLDRIQCMKHRIGLRWGLYRQPIDLLKKVPSMGTKVTSKLMMMLLCNWFLKGSRRWKFKYEGIDLQWIDVESTISTMTMLFDERNKIYMLDEDEYTTLNEFVAKSK